jgi:hypothetical protein
MPKAFIYVGKDESSPDQITVRGLTFELNGGPVTVLDEALANGLSGNPQFEEQGGSDVDYGDAPYDPDLDQIIAAQTARIEELETTNALLVSENQELRAQLGQGAPVAEPEAPADYTEDDDSESSLEEVFAEIDAEDDWSTAHHSTRKRWANAILPEGQSVENLGEADEVILGALVDREQDQD